MIVKERLYLDADRKKVVKEGDHKAAYLLAGAGQEIPDSIAKQYGLFDSTAKKKEEPKNKMVKEPSNKGFKLKSEEAK